MRKEVVQDAPESGWCAGHDEVVCSWLMSGE